MSILILCSLEANNLFHYRIFKMSRMYARIALNLAKIKVSFVGSLHDALKFVLMMF